MNALTAAPARYSRTAIALHWLMALLLLAQFAIGWSMIDIPKRTPAVAFYYNLHKSLGLLAFGFVLFRLWWRARMPAPAAADVVHSALQEKAAQLSHQLLYVCMVLLPLCGFLGSNFGKHPVRFFGVQLPRVGWDSPMLEAAFRQMHGLFAWMLMILIAVHLAAVAYHLATSGTRIVMRMVPR